MSQQPPDPPAAPPASGDQAPGQPTPHADQSSESKKPWFKRWWGITLIVLGIIVFLGIIAGPDDEAADDPIADEPEDEPAEAVEDELESEPQAETDAEAEPEPEPATDPEPVVEEPEPAPEPEPEPESFEAVTIEGSGDDIVDVPVVDDHILVATFTHDGQSNFAVTSYDQGGNRLDLMVNHIGSYQGTVPYNFEVSPNELEINADGPWTVSISDLLEQPALEDSQDGVGDQVLLLATSGRLTATHGGDSNFALLAWGQRRDLLVNEVGAYEGTVRLPEAIALEIVADGEWSLLVQ